VRANVDRARERSIASAVAKQVEHNDAVAGWYERDDVAPETAGRRKPVDEYDRIAGAARAGRVIVEAGTGQIEELTAHQRPWIASRREDATSPKKRNAGRHVVAARVARSGNVGATRTAS
jgi:hypothetical protein